MKTKLITLLLAVGFASSLIAIDKEALKSKAKSFMLKHKKGTSGSATDTSTAE
jgi:hypothetical protein